MGFHISIMMTVLAVSLSGVSCKKKQKKSDDGAVTASTVASTTTATPPEGSLRVQLEDVPAAYSPLDKIRVVVKSEGGDFYRYQLLHDANDCSDAKYGTWRGIDTPIQEDLDGDGAKILCVVVRSGTEAVNVSATSYRWVKDAVAPSATIDGIGAFGPHYTAGTGTTLTGSTADASGVSAVSVSIQRSGAGCLNAAGTAFDEACPHKKPANLSGGSWSLVFSDSAFTANASYDISVHPVDAAGNEGTSTASATWDTTAPASPGILTVTPGAEQLSLSWGAAAGSAQYVVVRRAANAVTTAPTPGMSYQAGQLLDAVHAIAYVGSATNVVDVGLLPFTTYYYAVYALDGAHNLSAPVTGNALTAERPRFRGISYAAAVEEDKTMRVEWQPFAPEGIDPSLMTYELYVASSPGGQDFGAPPQANVVGGQSLYYRYPGTSPNIYLVVRARTPGGEIDTNTREMPVRFGATTHHKIAFNGRLLGHSPLYAYLDTPWAVAKDPWGNYLFSGESGIVNVLCREVASAPYCKQRLLERVYTLAGTDGIGSGQNDVPASQAGMGVINAIAVDAGGNVFVADTNNFMIRALCFAPLQAGFCYTKNPGHHYIVSGSGVSGDGGNGVSAASASIGTPRGLALTTQGDIFVGDAGFRRLRVICQQNAVGFCAGKSVGNIYRFVGTGANADGADDTVASATLGTGDVGAVFLDGLNNVYWTDTNYRRVRVVCFDVSAGAGFCASKASGKHYRIMGTGVAGNGGDDIAASTAPMGQSFGIVLDTHKNIYVSDLTYPFVRLICQSTSGTCSGRSVGNVYQYAGTGATTNGADGVNIALAGLGDPRGLEIDAANNLIVVDSRYKYLRALCAEDVAGTVCEGRLPSYHHLLAGSGSSYAGVEYASALNTPMGTLQGTAVDPNGNVFVADSAGFRVRVICYDTTSPGICLGKTYGYNYFAAGTGVAGDGADGNALIRAIGAVYGLASDAAGNIYMADTGYRRIRVLCNNVAAAGFCNGKVAGSTYRLAGTGAAGDGADNALAATTAMGQPYGVALDSFGNIFIADYTYRRIRAVCLNTAGGFCTGKTAGNAYRLGGTGAAGDGNSGAPGATAVGTLTAIALDGLNNIYVGDSQYFRVRAICYDVSAAAGFCAGKTVDTMYRVIGTGATGNGADNAVAASTGIGIPAAIAIDAANNLYVADHTYYFVRSICFDVTAGHCSGLTSGNTYRLIGTGVTGDGESNVGGALATLGNAGYGGLTFTASGQLLRTDSINALRLFMKP